MRNTLLYVNVYAVTRHYGGPEEGGWWYDAGEPLASIPMSAEIFECPKGECDCPHEDGVRHRAHDHEERCSDDPDDTYPCPPDMHVRYDRDQFEKLKKSLEGDFAHEVYGNIGSVLGGQEVRVCLEDNFATHWPRERPRYE